MSTKTADVKAEEYRDSCFEENPNGFHCAPYVNAESLSDAWLAGHAEGMREAMELVERVDAFLECHGESPETPITLKRMRETLAKFKAELKR